MAAYVNALKQFRRGLSQEGSSPQVQETPRRGIVSAPRQMAMEQTQQATKTLYEPAKFVRNGISQLRQIRMEIQKGLSEKPGGFAKGLAAGIQQASSKKSVETRVVTPYVDAPDGPKGKEVYNIPQVKGSGSIKEDTKFLEGVKSLADKYGTTSAELLSLMHFESAGSFDPAKRNGIGATGLIQFIPSTAKDLGTSTDALAGMSRMEQLEWVDKYFSQTPIRNIEKPTGEDLYMSVLWPKAVGKPSDYVLWKEGSREYRQNKGLDIGGKGYITKRDAAQKAMQYIDYYKEF